MAFLPDKAPFSSCLSDKNKQDGYNMDMKEYFSVSYIFDFISTAFSILFGKKNIDLNENHNFVPQIKVSRQVIQTLIRFIFQHLPNVVTFPSWSKFICEINKQEADHLFVAIIVIKTKF